MFKLKTARDLTLEEIKKYHKFDKEREEKKKKELVSKYNQAWSLTREVAQILYHEYNAEKVVVFGSLSNIDYFNQWSDIDLAVWGIKPEVYFRAVAKVLSLSSKFKIDIVDPGDCSESLKEVIRKEGIVI